MTSATTFSLKLYNYLCEVVGSEKVVATRRLYFRTTDYVSNSINRSHKHFFHISSGSKAEGLDFHDSDLDIMYVSGLPVYSHTSHSTNKHILCYDADNTLPGFVHIKVCSERSSVIYTVHTENGILLSSDKFKQCVLNRGICHDPFFKIHGPCIAKNDDSIDLACCFRCYTWPSLASAWIGRARSSGWPDFNLISDILEEGVLFVPIGSCETSHNDPHDWRISFSVGEKMLIHSFNHTQFLCYALLKFILKEVLDENSKITKLLCSYFMKTVLFWVMEEVEASTWIPQNLFECFRLCLKRLIYFVNCGYCPNYFIPENNMFKGKIYGTAKQDLETIINGLYTDGMTSILRCKSLAGFHTFQANKLTLLSEDVDNALFPLLHINHLIYFEKFGEPYIRDVLKRMDILRCGVSTVTKELFVHTFVTFIRNSAFNIEYDYQLCNKRLYSRYKYFRCLFLLGTKRDVVSDWLTLAMFFYQHQQFCHVLMITNYALSECSPDKIYISLYDRVGKCITPFEGRHLSFSKRHKLTCAYQMCVKIAKKSFIERTELGLKHWIETSSSFDDQILSSLLSVFSCKYPMLSKESLMFSIQCLWQDLCIQLKFIYSNSIQASPLSFGHFIRFMCFRNMKKTDEMMSALHDLTVAVEQNYFARSPHSRFLDCCLLLKAIDVSNNAIDIPAFVKEIFFNFSSS